MGRNIYKHGKIFLSYLGSVSIQNLHEETDKKDGGGIFTNMVKIFTRIMEEYLQ